MKTTNILYWIFTVLITGLMLFSAVASLASPDASAKLMHDQLGYPVYLVPFLSVAKLLGCIAILVPAFPRLKEWAYAGFAFDLIGATWSSISIKEPVSGWAPMLIFIAILFLSYIFWHKKLAAKTAK